MRNLVELPFPSNEDDFEELCLEIAKEYFKDQDAYRFGKKGQRQHGVDIYVPSKKLGIQCKKKELETKKLDEKKDIEAEVVKAYEFPMELKEYCILTTVDSHTEAQVKIDSINNKHEAEEKFKVKLWGWEIIEKKLLGECPNTFEKYKDDFLPPLQAAFKEGYSRALILEECVKLLDKSQPETALNLLGLIEKTKTALDDKTSLLFKKTKARTLWGVEKPKEAISLYNEIIAVEQDLECLISLYEIHTNLNLKEDAQAYFVRAESSHPNSDKVQIQKLIQNLHEGIEIDASKSFPNEPREHAKLLMNLYFHHHTNRNIEARDELINKHENLFPESSRPEVFRTIFSIDDAFEKHQSLTSEELKNLLCKISSLDKRLVNKNAIAKRDRIKLLLQQIKIQIVLGAFKPLDAEVVENREKIINELLECYFDIFSDGILQQLLSLLFLSEQQFKKITTHIKNCDYKISNSLSLKLSGLFILYNSPIEEVEAFCAAVENTSIIEIFKLVKEKNAADLITKISKFDDNDKVITIQSIQDLDFKLKIIDLVLAEETPTENYREALAGLKIQILFEKKSNDKILELMDGLGVNPTDFNLLNIVHSAAHAMERWDVENAALKKLIQFEIPNQAKFKYYSYLADINCRLRQYDEASDYAIKALDLKPTGENDRSLALEKILLTSLISASKVEKALELIDVYKTPEDLQLSNIKADILTKNGRGGEALEKIQSKFKEIENPTSEQYFSSFTILNDLHNDKIIDTKSRSSVEDGNLVKIEGIESWFLINSDKKQAGCVAINQGDNRYTIFKEAVLGGTIILGDKTRKVEVIYDFAAYLLCQASRAMAKLSEQGESYIKSFELPKDPQEMIKALKEQFESINKHKDSFFDSYLKTPFPFSFLIKSEGDIWKALSKLKSSNQGFVRISSGAKEDLDSQLLTAHNIVDSNKVILDGTSILFLSLSGCLSDVLDNIKNVVAPKSAITMLQDLANLFTPLRHQTGRIGLINGQVRLSNIDVTESEKFCKLMLDAAELLKSKAELIDSIAATPKANKYMTEQLSPPYVVDAARYAEKNNLIMLSDDYNYLGILQIENKTAQLQRCSSYFLIKALVDKKLIKKASYLKHFKTLSQNRAHLLSISVDIMWDAIFSLSNGLVEINPKNINYLNLKLTLSKEYGVDEGVSAAIVANFISKVVHDLTITAEVADKIFAVVLNNFFLPYRNSRQLGHYIVEVCKRNIAKSDFIIIPVSPSVKQKLNVLSKQINTFNHFAYNSILDLEQDPL